MKLFEIKIISIDKVDIDELTSYSRFFKSDSYQKCDRNLSFIYKNDINEFCGFALIRNNNINLKYKFSEEVEITNEMNGCEILQVYAKSINIELKILKQLMNSIRLFKQNGISFDYFWSESLSDYDYYLDILDCTRVLQQISMYEQKTIVYGKIN